ncbi:MAG TPA: helix-turn-helix transcriptional regulator [Gammaproteobacteria bacterium]
MEIHVLFGRHIRFLRQRAGLTQEKLAEAVRLSPVSISNIERGLYAPAFHRLPELARALGVTIHELFTFKEAGR